MPSYQGSCHCGSVRFEIDVDVERLSVCNCSVCTKKGVVHVPVPVEGFRLLSGQQELTLYQFGSNTAKHWFCRRCGIHTHGRPRTAPERFTVNARCLDEFDALTASVEMRYFDGRNHPGDRIA